MHQMANAYAEDRARMASEPILPFPLIALLSKAVRKITSLKKMGGWTENPIFNPSNITVEL